MTREEASVLLKMMFAFWANTHERTNVEMEMALNLALTALRPISREQVEKMWRGEWILDEDDGKYQCDNCKIKFPVNYNFCPYCGSAKTEKAMQKVIGKLESLEEMKNG